MSTMATTPIPPYIAGLKQMQMKTAAFLLGSPTSGRKPDIANVLSLRLSNPPPRSEFSKVLSIDMGIRNMGICVLEASHLSQSQHSIATKALPLVISSWNRVDVLGLLKTKHAVDIWDSDSATAEVKEILRLRHRKNEDLLAVDFTPASLAEAAYTLVSSLLVQHRPTGILIERQRFRTGSSSTVHEWTLRVNLLEHMIWTCLKTLGAQYRSHDGPSPGSLGEAAAKLKAVREVSPAKVARFWCSGLVQDMQSEIVTAGNLLSGSHTPGISKITKADKVAVAQGWVDQWKTGSSEADGGVRLDFQGTAADTADSFQSYPEGRKPRKKKGQDAAKSEEPIGKLDDLADCLLQGVAWVKWEENRRRLARLVANG